jgi:predicted acylesterase/phospholipase RssA
VREQCRNVALATSPRCRLYVHVRKCVYLGSRRTIGVPELNVTIAPNTIRCMKRGLVLEGGGAKGAYEFGCLLAFRDRGVRFDAVAGTSIGAINGLLWASDKVYEERDTWANLNDETAFKRRISGWIRPMMLFWFHHYQNSLRGLMHTALPAAVIRLPQHVYLLGTILVATTFYMGTFLAYAQLARSSQDLIVAIGVVGTLLLLFDVIFLSQKHFTPWLKLATIGLIALSALIHAASLQSGEAVCSELWVVVPSCIILLFYIGYWYWSREVFFDNGPLRELVSRVISEGIKIPLYVTMAEEDLVVDPDRPVWGESTARGAHLYWLEPNHQFFPNYINIAASPRELTIDSVLASAALPFGLTKSIVIGEKAYVDGGVVDNCPLYPLIAFEECTEIVVIRLSPGARKLADVTTEIREIDRLQRVRRAQPVETSWGFDAFDYALSGGFQKPYRYSDPPATVPFRDFTHRMPRLWYVSPNKKLGGLFSGTLNFSKTYAAELIGMGYQDGIQFLNTTGIK